MRQAPPLSYLGPALVLYLLAGAMAAHQALDAEGVLVALVAAALSLSPALSRRGSDAAARRAGWLGLASGLALVRVVAGGGLSLAVDLAHATGLCAASALLVTLALRAPDRVASPGRTRVLQLLVTSTSAAVLVLAVLAVAPAITWHGFTYVAPARLAKLPLALAACALVVATVLRLSRRRLGSGPEALASNAWALLGLLPALVLGVALVAAQRLGVDPALPGTRVVVALIAVSVTWGHFRLVDPHRRLSVGPATRDACAAVLTFAAAAGLAAVARPLLPEAPFAFAAIAIAWLVASLALYRGLRSATHWLLAPASGQLLSAFERAATELSRVTSLRDVAGVALRAARQASGSAAAEPWLYLLSPAASLHVDAAGVPHEGTRALHPELLARLRAATGELVLRAPLEAQLVRSPALRPLVDALVALDALCVLPLTVEGELEGALVIPRGGRRSALTLEELEALRAFARLLTGFVAVLGAEARAQERARVSHGEVEHERGRAAELTAAMARLGTELEQLRADRSREALDVLVSYSRATRTALERLRVASREGGVQLLVAEEGVGLNALAVAAHRSGGRGEEAFVVGDCASLTPERAARALFGGADTPGLLRMASGGTLLLYDLPALPADAQRALAAALQSRMAFPVDGGEAYPVRGLLLCTSRVPLTRLAEHEGLVPELVRLLGERVVRVPPLRERREDFASLLLLALDRACRVLGRPVVGVEPEAQAVLEAYAWPGNERELTTVVEKAVSVCTGPRVTMADLALPGAAEPENPLDARFDVVERRVLLRALERAEGNKSEAARLLGLKRTTFLDKLRRHELDGAAAAGARPN